MRDYLKLIRVKHYIKNLLIFFPIVFSGNLFDAKELMSIIFAFLAFSFAASIVYIINDIRDKEKDKLHEKKKNRPIASGRISIRNAILCAVVLFILSFLCQFLATGKIITFSYLFVVIYLIINILYSLGLKDYPLVDIAILASGFLIRVLYGASVIHVEVSNWLYLTVLSAAFYLGLGKRRNEIIKVGKNSRPVLKYYTKEFLDKNMYMCLGIAIIFYALWTTDAVNVIKTNNMLIWTVPLVILILMKYSMNIENDSYGDPVDIVIHDKLLLALLLVYAVILISIVYCGAL